MNDSIRMAGGRTTAQPGVCHGSPCVVCGQADWATHFRILRRCGSCGFVRAAETLNPEQLNRLYAEDYFRGKEYGDYLADGRGHAKNCAYRFQLLQQVAGRLESMFEVGCAYGFWLAQLSAQGVRCTGVDICAEAVDHATRTLCQQAVAGDFLELPLPPGKYQAFCMWDTIEHLAHPEQFVERIFELLPPGGWFFATTGDIGSRVAQRRGPHWRMIHPPTHLQYFSQETMTRFLRRHGFEVVEVRSTSMYRSCYGTLSTLLALGRGLARRVAWVADKVIPKPVQKRIGFWLDLGDIMLVCARKPLASARERKRD